MTDARVKMDQQQLFIAGLRIVGTALVVGALVYAAYMLCGDQFSVLLVSFALVEALHAPIQGLREALKQTAARLEDGQAPIRDFAALMLRAVKQRDWKFALLGMRRAVVEHSIVTFLAIALIRLQPSLVLGAAVLLGLNGLVLVAQLRCERRCKNECGRRCCGTRCDVRALRYFAQPAGSALLMMAVLLATSITLASVVVVPAVADVYAMSVDLVQSGKSAIESDATASRWRSAVEWSARQIEHGVTEETRPLFESAQKGFTSDDLDERSVALAATATAGACRKRAS